MLQNNTLDYQIEMFESTPFIQLMFQATVPLTCPGCDPLMVEIARHVGLTVSTCALRFVGTDPVCVRIRAVQTAGKNARIVSLKFAGIEAPGMPWHRYQINRISVLHCIIIIILP